MAPIIKKGGSSPTGKAGVSLISKANTGKSNSVMKFGSKQNNSSSLAGKISSSSFGDKKAAISSGKNNTSHFSNTSNKISGTQSFDGKRSTTHSFVELGACSKSPKVSGDPFKTITDKNDVSSYMGPKNKKSSVKFGIMWLPTRKRNKMKDTVYNPYDTDRRDLFKERTPTMYNL